MAIRPSGLEQQILAIRQRSDILVMYPMATGANWLGVGNATRRMFGASCLEMPQYYSHPVLTESEMKTLAGTIASVDFKTLIFSGFPLYFSGFIRHIKKECPDVRICVLYHGSLSQWVAEPVRTHTLELLRLCRDGIVERTGYVKKGMAGVVSRLFNIKAWELMVPPGPVSDQPRHFNDSVKIGVPGTSSFNKNLHNQVAGALMTDDSTVHVLDESLFTYMNNPRIQGYGGLLNKEDFLNFIGSMSVNLYLSYSECFPQVVIESLSLGVPCITSNNNGIFDHDPYLAEWLVALEYDNPEAIGRHVEKVLENRNELSVKGLEYIRLLNEISEKRVLEFAGGGDV